MGKHNFNKMPELYFSGEHWRNNGWLKNNRQDFGNDSTKASSFKQKVLSIVTRWIECDKSAENNKNATTQESD